MEEITAREIVQRVGICPEPSYYSGRGARSDDLSGEQLFKIHQIIKEELGKSQAREFVIMIRNLSCLSATNFLKSLYELEDNTWGFYKRKESNVDLGTHEKTRGVIAFATIFSYNTGDATHFIRRTFLDKLDVAERCIGY